MKLFDLRMALCLLGAFVYCTNLVPTASAQSFALNPDRDTMVFGRAPNPPSAGADSNFGARDIFTFGQDSIFANQYTATLMAFDLSGITPGSVVDPAGATLTMTTFGFFEGDGTPDEQADWEDTSVDVFQIKAVDGDWVEGDNGVSSPDADGEPTWSHKAFNTTQWTAGAGVGLQAAVGTSGADLKANGNASLTPSISTRTYFTPTQTPGPGAKHTWDIPASVLQGWIDDPFGNGGLLIFNTNVLPTSGPDDRPRRNLAYFSREAATEADRPLLQFTVTPAGPQTIEWNVNGTGDWIVAGNWNPNIFPNGDQMSVLFGSVIDNSTTVVTDTDVTVNSVEFNNTSRYAVAGTGTISFAGATPAVTVTSGAHDFHTRLNLLADTTVTVSDGTGLSVNGVIELGGNNLTIDRAPGGTTGLVNINNATTGAGSVTNNATLGSLGASTLGFSLENNEAGTLQIDLGSNVMDSFHIQGDADLAGTLDVALEDGFTPSGSYTVLTPAGLLTDNGLALSAAAAESFSMEVSQGAGGTVVLTTVPEPSSAVFGGLALLALVLTRSRARRWQRPPRACPCGESVPQLTRTPKMRFHHVRFALFVTTAILISSSLAQLASAADFALNPDRDTMLHGGTAQHHDPLFIDRNFGARNILGPNQDSQTEDTVTLMSFDVTGIAPGNTVAGDATLTLTTNGFFANDGILADRQQWWTTRVDIFQIKPVDADWEEGAQAAGGLAALEAGSTWNRKSNALGIVNWAAGDALGIGGLSPSDANDFRDNGLIPDPSSPGDTIPNPSLTASIAFRQYAEDESTLPTVPISENPAGGIKHSWTLPASLIQDWIDNPANNAGIAVFNIGAINNSVIRNLYYRSSDHVNMSDWPLLEFSLFPGGTVAAEWDRNGTGDWMIAGNWDPVVVPDGDTFNVRFGGVIDNPTTVVTDAAVTVNTSEFDNANKYAVAGTGSISLAGTTPSVAVTSGAHEFQVDIILAESATVTVADDTTLDFNAPVALGGNSLTIDPAAGATLMNGVVNINNATTGAGTVTNNATLGTGGATSISFDLNNSATGTLLVDLGPNNTDSFDVLGNATLDGTLDVVLEDGFAPSGSFTVLTASFLDDQGLALSAAADQVFDLLVTPGAGGTVQLTTGGIVLPDGDFDASNLVDLLDLNLVLFNWQQLGADLPVDWVRQKPGDAEPVGLNQLNAVLFNWQQMGSLTASVPEPNSFCLFALAAVFGFVGRWLVKQ